MYQVSITFKKQIKMYFYVFLSLTSDIKVEINDRLDINNCSVIRSEDNSVCVCVCKLACQTVSRSCVYGVR